MIKTVLLIDDEEQIRKLTKRLIGPHGYRVVEAEHGAQGLERAREQDFSLIILDHQMPVMDGLAFLKALREELRSDTPVLMMSGNADRDLRSQCFRLGVFDFISKLESPDIVLARIENGMKISELLDFRRKMEIEMRISESILKDIAVPREVQGSAFRLRTANRGFSRIGGDLFIAFGLETGCPVFCIGDISGHGVSASLFTAFVAYAARRAYREALVPHRILTRLNRELSEYLPGNRFVSMFCCSYDVAKRLLHYANAGHPAPYLCRAGKVIQVDDGDNPILGFEPHQQYEGVSVAFEPGDWLLLYTDGMLDMYDGKDFSTDNRLAEVCLAGDSADATFGRLEEHLDRQQNFTDDRTIMMLAAL